MYAQALHAVSDFLGEMSLYTLPEALKTKDVTPSLYWWTNKFAGVAYGGMSEGALLEV